MRATELGGEAPDLGGIAPREHRTKPAGDGATRDQAARVAGRAVDEERR